MSDERKSHIFVKISPLYRLCKGSFALSILITVIPGFFLGLRLPSFDLVFYTLLGTWLVAASSFAYNQIIEVKIDALMERTRGRPLVQGEFAIPFAHIFASSLLALGLAILALGSHPLAALLALFSFLHYVFVYTMLLKKRSSWNTLLGGLSGSIGPLIGEASVTGGLSKYGFAMFLLLFLWQPPHFWCLALHYKKDYQRAQIPVLPAISSPEKVYKHTLFYQFLLCLCMLFLCVPGLGAALLGWIFLTPSLLWALFVLYCMWSLLQGKNRLHRFFFSFRVTNLRVFFLSIVHMLIWHIAVSFDLYTRFYGF